MVMIEVGSPKMAREMLCAVQHQIEITQMPSGTWHSANISKMIEQLDKHRPLGVDGKHGERHTLTCGCDIEKRIGVYGRCELDKPHEGHILFTGVTDNAGTAVLQSCPGQYAECSNCDDRLCMACVMREWHDNCEEDCPMCCSPTNKKE